MRLSPPSKNGFIWRYILLVGGSGIVEECKNQRRGRYLKKWSLTTVLSDIQKRSPGKTFPSTVLLLQIASSLWYRFIPVVSLSYRTLYEIHYETLMIHVFQHNFVWRRQKIDACGGICRKTGWVKCFPWVGLLYITQGNRQRPFFEITTSPLIFALL